jgi:hypothetical protein
VLIPIPNPHPGLLAALLLVPAVASAQVQRHSGILADPSAGRTFEAVPATPPPVGPAPQNIGLDASGTYGVIAKVIWAPAPNAVSYVVKRRLMEDPACCNASSGPLTTTSWTDTGLLRKGHYIFTIMVNYADGSVGSAEFGIGADGVRNPSPVTVQDIAPGRVRLSWDPAIPGTSGVKVTGPGLGPSGEQVTGGGPIDTGLLPPGPQTWALASIYANNLGILSPPSEWTRVTHDVRYGNGRYRISLEGFKAISVTAEDPFRADGRGDEVFITTQVSEYGRNGSLRSTRMARTPTFGDVQNFPARIRAGSASSTGGIMPNDQYPAPVELISQLQPATVNNLPYLLWEGELTEIDNAVVLSPAIWESDGGDELVPHYMTFQTGIAPWVSYWQKMHPYIPNTYGSPLLDTWNPQRLCPAPLGKESPSTFFQPPINGWRDEPMDMTKNRTHCPTYVAVNWRIANSMTTVNPAAVVEIPFTSDVAGWTYKLFVRIEKVAPTARIAPVSRRRAAGP